MKKYWTFLTALTIGVISITSCGSNSGKTNPGQPTTNTAEGWAWDSVVYNTKVEFNNDDPEAVRFVRAHIVFPKFNNAVQGKKDICNDYIQKYWLNAFESSFIEESSKKGDLNQDLQAYVEEYRKVLKESPDMQTPYEFEGKTEVMNISNNVITLHHFLYINSGGAHPQAVDFYENLDLATIKPLRLNMVFADSVALLPKLEAGFRKARSISDETSLESQGFFEDTRFFASDNFALLKDSVLFYYNAYDAGSYALGPTVVKLAYSELNGVIKKEYAH